MRQPTNPFDPVLLSQVRLGVMSILMTREEVSFSDLRSLLGLTQGNLGSHLQNLEKAGYITIEKSFVDRKPRTTARIAPAGRTAFRQHVATLDEIVRSSGDEEDES